MNEERFFIGRLAERAGVTPDTIQDIGEVLGLVEEGREPCEHVRERLSRRLDETRARMQELRRLEARLLNALDRAEAAGHPNLACRCHIIERTPSTGRRPGPSPGRRGGFRAAGGHGSGQELR